MKTNQQGVIPLIIFVISLGLSVSALRTIVDLWHRRDIMVERQTELSNRTKENKKLEEELQQIGTDQYAEKIARDTLGLVKEGEAIVILPGTGSRNSNQKAGSERISNWEKWWQLFF